MTTRAQNGRFVKKKNRDRITKALARMLDAKKRKIEKTLEEKAQSEISEENSIRELAKNLKCTGCRSLLDMEKLSDFTREGLHLKFKIKCDTCTEWNLVNTGLNSNRVSDINSSEILGALPGQRIPEIMPEDSPTRKLRRNRKILTQENTSQDDLEDNEVEKELQFIDPGPSTSHIPGQPDQVSLSTFSSTITSNRRQNPRLRKRKTSSKCQRVKASKSSKNAPKIGTQNQSTDYMDDEFDIFARDIAIQLRGLPYYIARQCQDKIRCIINEEQFNFQQSHHQQIETIIIKREPGLSEEEETLHPVSSQGTIETIINEEPVIDENEYSHPVSSQGTIETIIIKREPGLSEDEYSHPVSSQGTIETIINEEPVIN